jgi:O-antigen/teichoic acid export membrane protein
MDATLRPSVQLAVGRAAGYAISFFIPLVLVRFLDQSQFGTYKQLFLVYSTLYTIGQIGMAESLFYFLPQFPRSASSFVMNSLAALAVSGVACALLVTVAAEPLARWLGDVHLRPLLPVFGLFLALALASAPLEIALISRQRFIVAAAVYAVSELVKAVCLLVPAILFRDVRALIVGVLAFAAARWVAGLVILRREFHGLPRPSRALLVQQLAYAAPFTLYVVVEIVKSSWHQYVVATHVDAAMFAVYAVGCLQIPFVDFVAGPAGNVMMVEMRTSLREARKSAVLQVWHATTTRIAIVIVPLVVLVMISAHDLVVTLFTARYAGSVPVLLAWTPSLLFAVLQTDGVLRVFAKTRTLLILSLLQLLVTVATVGWCLSRWGLPGAALATVLALAVGKLAGLVLIKRLIDVRFGELLPWKNLLIVAGASALAAAVTLGFELRFDLRTPLLLACASTIFVAAYSLVLLAWWALQGGAAGPSREPSSCVESQAL